jgi:hypothetical protein
MVIDSGGLRTPMQGHDQRARLRQIFRHVRKHPQGARIGAEADNLAQAAWDRRLASTPLRRRREKLFEALAQPGEVGERILQALHERLSLFLTMPTASM